jgi:hypothetical protein
MTSSKRRPSNMPFVELVKDDQWIKTKIGNCVKKHISERTFLEEILPVMKDASSGNLTLESFEGRLAELAETSLVVRSDIALTMECITSEIYRMAQEVGPASYKDMFLPLGCALFARYFSIISREIGYVRIK